jgi:hypothetical protein
VKRLFFAAFMAVPSDRLPNEMGMLQTDPDLLRAGPALCRCVIGNLSKPVAIDPSWLTPTAVSLVEAIYHDRQLPSGLFDNQRLAILADALEEAGCTDEAILSHCRGPGPHVRGCWVVDLLLGKG